MMNHAAGKICFFTGHKTGKRVIVTAVSTSGIVSTGKTDMVKCPRCGTTWKVGKRPKNLFGR